MTLTSAEIYEVAQKFFLNDFPDQTGYDLALAMAVIEAFKKKFPPADLPADLIAKATRVNNITIELRFNTSVDCSLFEVALYHAMPAPAEEEK